MAECGTMRSEAIFALLALVGCPWTLGATATETTQIQTVDLKLSVATRPGEFTSLQLDPVFPDEPLMLIVEVENDTESEVQFVEVHAGCHCTSGELPLSPLATGGRAPLFLRFNLTGQSGSHEQLITYHLMAAGESLFINLDVAVELRRDIQLDWPSLLVAYHPDSPDSTIESRPVRVLLDETSFQTAPRTVQVELLSDPPPGVEFTPGEGSGDEIECPHVIRIDLSALEDTPRSFTLPLLIRVFGSEGEALAQARRGLTVTMQPGVRLVTDPADLFLGILNTEQLPLERSFTISLDPELLFRVSETSGQAEGLHWHMTPSAPGSDLCVSWTLVATLEEVVSAGSQHHLLPLEMICRDETGTYAQEFTLIIEYIVVP